MGSAGTTAVSRETPHPPGFPELGEYGSDEGVFLPLLWDPIHPAAGEVLQHTWGPVRRRLQDALAAVAELSDLPGPTVRASEVAGFYFTLITVLSSVVPMAEKRRALFLQGIAAHTYRLDELREFSSPEEYWEFLNLRHAEYTAASRSAPSTKPLIAFIDHFLCHVDLGGSDNADVIFGLYRYLPPRIAEATHLLREAANRARGQVDPY